MHSFHSNTIRTQAVSLKAIKKPKWPLSTKNLKALFWLFVSEDPKDGEGKNCDLTMEVRLRGKHEQKSSWHWRKPHKGRKWKWSRSVVPDSLWPMDCSPPSSSVHGILQARILQWVAISFSRGSSRPRDRTQVSHVAGRCFNLCATREAHKGQRDCEFRSQRPSRQTGALCFRKRHHFLFPQQRAVLWLHHHSSFCDPTSFPSNSLASLSKGKTLSSPESLST